jgi:hypothetical protein
VQPSSREALRHRPSGASLALALLLVLLVVGLQLQRGAAEAHHNYDAPLTIEAPWALLPCDLALCAYPALVVDPLASSLAWLRLAAGVTGRLGPAPGPPPVATGTCAPDAPRAPPLRSHTSSS